jgi:diacylglycerol kinase family enzyme
VNGLGRDIPFAALPGGGTRVFSRALGLPRDAVAAASHVAGALAAGRTRRIALGTVNGRRFLFACGVGLDAAAVRRVDARGRSRDGRRPGDTAFAWELARVLASSRFRLGPALEVDGLGRAAAALVANGDPYTYAGAFPLHVAPEARFELGLDVVAPVSIAATSMPRFLGYLLRGDGQQRAGDVLYRHDVDELRIVCDRPLPLQVDGEDLGDVEHADLRTERDALTVVV